MSRIIVLQRVVPHYRRAIFERLHDELGWIVAAGDSDVASGLDTVSSDEPWLRQYSFQRDPHRQYAARIDLDMIYRDLRPDAVVAEFSLQMNSTWRLAADAFRRRGPRLAFWSQGPNVERGFSGAKDIASQVTRVLLMRSSDAQLCYSSAGANYLRRYLPRRQPIFVAANTIDFNSLPRSGCDTSPAAGPDANLLFIGRVTHDKRLEVAIRSMFLLREKMPNVRLTVVGDGPALRDAQDLAAPLGNAVKFLGQIYDQNMLARIFEDSSMLIVPGSAGLNVNHALAYKVPVMLFDDAASVHHHPEHHYIVDGKNGFRVAPTNERALADNLIVALSGPSPKRKLAAGIDDTLQNDISIDRMLDGFRDLNFYFRTLPSRGPSL